jgi:L-histidine N-alpha-methyltransferase
VQPVLEHPAAVTDLLATGRFTLRHTRTGPQGRGFAADVRSGLTARPKALAPKYFYDKLGSRLFEAITALPEYYLTRAETEILRARAPEIARRFAGPVRLVELGSGSGRKTRLLLQALLARGSVLYTPMDISVSALEASSRTLLALYPGLEVAALAGDYAGCLAALDDGEPRPGRTLALFLGSSLGNLDPSEQRDLFALVRTALKPGDAFLLGTDLKKDEGILVPAYADALGVTAAFNLNLLARVNRELGGAFPLQSFRHLARWNREAGRIEMHLESLIDQTIPIRDLEIEVHFAAGETVHTESCYKFDREQIAALAETTGFELAQLWADCKGRFASSLLVAAG